MSFAKKFLPLIFGIFLLAPYTGWADSAQFECGEESDTTTQLAVPKTGVAKAVVIYATWDSTTNPKKDTMPERWARVWDTARQLSVPKFYKDNSLGKYSLQSVPYGRNTVRCFASPIAPIRPLVQAAFNEDILRRADSVINFANFDANGDHIVDGVFIVIVNYLTTGGVGNLFLTNLEFVTRDSVAGQPIKISTFQGTA